MKDALRKLSLLTAVLLVTAAGAYAQDSLRAKIPFDFSASGKLLPAGEYELQRVSMPVGVRVLQLRKTDGGQSAFLIERYSVDTAQWREPELLFGCLDGKCSIQKIYAGGYGGWAVGFPSKGSGHELQAKVRLERVPAD
jgi:hypothetical protein